MEDEKKQMKGQINIDLKEDIAQGVYSNLAVITHSSAEFVLDFVRVMPGIPKAEDKSRIILTTEHAKRFLNALKDNVEKYEKMPGPIRKSEGGGPMMLMNFVGPTAQV